MAETLLEFHTPIAGPDGTLYQARAVGSAMPGGTWQGWIEFVSLSGGESVRTARETTQPNRQDTIYWATGLTAIYLEGALSRALTPLAVRDAALAAPPLFDEPAPAPGHIRSGETTDSVLDPFSVYEKGEALLRRQLGALSAWHLVNIIVDYELSDETRSALSRMPAAALIELIVNAVQASTRTR
jgi:hypothetical protein